MNKLVHIALLCALGIVLMVDEANALSNPCSYCTYCEFCNECDKCPCTEREAQVNKNCAYCKYCAYCSLCKFCSACGEGGIVEKAEEYYSKVVSLLGYSLDEVDDEEVAKDLNGFDFAKARRGMKKPSKDEL